MDATAIELTVASGALLVLGGITLQRAECLRERLPGSKKSETPARILVGNMEYKKASGRINQGGPGAAEALESKPITSL